MSSCHSVSAEPLVDLLLQGSRRARAAGRRILVSYAEPAPALDPLAVYAAAPAGTVRLFWHHQDRLVDGASGQALAGIGAVHTIEARGGGRFEDVKKAWRDLRLDAIVETSTGEAPPWGAGPLLLGGFSFDPQRPSTGTWRGFPDARFTLSRFTVASAGGRTWVTTNMLVDGEEDCEALTQDTLRERHLVLDRARAWHPEAAIRALASADTDAPAFAPDAVDGRPAGIPVPGTHGGLAAYRGSAPDHGPAQIHGTAAEALPAGGRAANGGSAPDHGPAQIHGTAAEALPAGGRAAKSGLAAGGAAGDGTVAKPAARLWAVDDPAPERSVERGAGAHGNVERAGHASSAAALVAVDALPAAEWQAIVGRTAAEIRAGRFAKVVLAREARVAAAETAFDAAATLDALRSTYRAGFVFAFTFPEGGADRTFLGASPERLVHLHDRVVETSSLAGSIRRGATPEEDDALGAALLRDEKERTEHAVVTETLREALAPLCRGLSVPAVPTLLRLANVQHLFTPIRGVLGNGQTILDLVERLHPTPAVGGFPRDVALAVIRAREQIDRGWYAGPVGWIDEEGEGEFAVAIRSALLDDSKREALLFAGCGIVGHSNPAAEYAESRLKMQAMLSALR